MFLPSALIRLLKMACSFSAMAHHDGLGERLRESRFRCCNNMQGPNNSPKLMHNETLVAASNKSQKAHWPNQILSHTLLSVPLTPVSPSSHQQMHNETHTLLSPSSPSHPPLSPSRPCLTPMPIYNNKTTARQGYMKLREFSSTAHVNHNRAHCTPNRFTSCINKPTRGNLS